jgi:hypothetical protein
MRHLQDLSWTGVIDAAGVDGTVMKTGVMNSES